MKSVAVVISVYSIDRANDAVDCIESVKNQTLAPKEIIVVLDPDDVLVDYYKKRLGSDVKLVTSDAFGLSSARNMGIKSSDSELIAFIDDDAVADCNWLKNIIANFEDPSVIGAGGRIIPMWPDKDPGWFPEELYWIVGCSYKGLPTSKAEIRNPIGCNMVFRRSLFDRVGLFSTILGRVGNVLLGHDDTEFGIRAKRRVVGSKIVYVPEAVVYHRVAKRRVSFRYVLERSYAEGFSKAFISRAAEDNSTSLDTERNYLRTLVLSIPSVLFQEKVQSGIPRVVTLWVASVMVFLGYFVGSRSK